jgi:hypothetical protein
VEALTVTREDAGIKAILLTVWTGMKMLNPVRAAKAATSVPTGVVASSLEKLLGSMETHRVKATMGPQSFADFERDVQARVMEVERDLMVEEGSRHDIDADAMVIDGKVHRRVLRPSQARRRSTSSTRASAFTLRWRTSMATEHTRPATATTLCAKRCATRRAAWTR